MLLQFPISTRIELANSVSRVLLSNEVKSTALSTAVHLRVVLEILGQALSLPLTASSTIEGSVRIYRRWLLDIHSRPPPLQDDDQFFCREMLKHLSLVFTPRNYGESDPSSVVCS